ncbi:MAG: nucleotidyltransferase family protein [Actinomycetota bacterium]|nr:nucleotidyltransferase family protein [Actinomycetota bacterium]
MIPPLADTLLLPSASIVDALRAVDRGAVAIALMVDGEDRLLGTVSDGDIRRALLSGHTLDDPVAPHARTRPQVVLEGTGRAEILDLMRARALAQIPIVDDDGRLVGMHLLRELLGRQDRPNWAVIMAGGRGTRLAPLTDSMPKGMLRVAGRPILERLVLHLVGSGVQRIFLSVNHLRELIENHFGDGSDFGCRIDYLREDPHQQLGTCGSLRLLLDEGHETDHPLLVINGDLVTEFSVENILASHDGSGAVATVALRSHTHTVPFGVVRTAGSRLEEIIEKPTHSWLISAGIYVLDPDLVDRIPARYEYHVPDLLQECLQRGEHVHAWECEDDWQDIGRPDELRRASGHAFVP